MSAENDCYLELFDKIGRLARQRRLIGDHHFSQLGLNHTEARLLSVLNEIGGEMSQDSLTSHINVDRTNIGRALQGLERSGLVVRSSGVSDRRTRIVQLTKTGEKIVKKIQALRPQMARMLFSGLAEAEVRVVLSALSGIKGEAGQ